MKKIVLLTTNERKRLSFSEAIKNASLKIDIEANSLWIPEIQSLDNKAVASFAAQYAANLLKRPVIKMDSGFFVEELNNFPGALVHHVADTIGVSGFFRLAEGLENRNARISNAVAYCEPKGEPVVFESTCDGILPK